MRDLKDPRNRHRMHNRTRSERAGDHGIFNDTANYGGGGGGGSTMKHRDEDGYTRVSKLKLTKTQHDVFVRYRKYQEEQAIWERQQIHTDAERRQHAQMTQEKDDFDLEFAETIDQLRRQGVLEAGFACNNEPVFHLSECMENDAGGSFRSSCLQSSLLSSLPPCLGDGFAHPEHIHTFAQGRAKETFFLTGALGQMAAITHVLSDRGWATFKIHTGQTQQSRCLACMLYPFFDNLNCYPISKQYTAHILAVGVGFRRDLAEQINLSQLILSCGSIDAEEMRAVCNIIEEFAYKNKIVTKEAY
jgi:hypothetical protein